VVVPTAGRREPLARLLTALCAGARRPDEIVVVDQARPPASLPPAPCAVRHVPDDRRGLSAARNLGVRHARGAVVAFIDDDCLPDPGWLAAIADGFAAHDDVAVITGPVHPLPPRGANVHPVSSRLSPDERRYAGDAVPWEVGTGGNTAVRRDRLAPDLAFDERLGAGSAGRAGEDTDFLRRALRGGATVLYLPGALVQHERTTARRRVETRFGYGHGIGAAIGLWLRAGDRYAIRALARWLRLRGRLALGAARHARGRGLLEEALMLLGTARGLLYAVRASGSGASWPPLRGD
jgi:GT2 family glycosyltransferase